MVERLKKDVLDRALRPPAVVAGDVEKARFTRDLNMRRLQLISATRMMWSIERTDDKDLSSLGRRGGSRPSTLRLYQELHRQPSLTPSEVDFLVHHCAVPIMDDAAAGTGERSVAYAHFCELAPFAHRSPTTVANGPFARDQLRPRVEEWTKLGIEGSYSQLWRAMLLVDALLAGRGTRADVERFGALNGTTIGLRHDLRGPSPLSRFGWVDGSLQADSGVSVERRYFVLGLNLARPTAAAVRAGPTDDHVRWRAQFSLLDESGQATGAFAPIVVHGTVEALLEPCFGSAALGIASVEVRVTGAGGGAGASGGDRAWLFLPLRIDRDQLEQLRRSGRAPELGHRVTAFLCAGPLRASKAQRRVSGRPGADPATGGFQLWLRDPQSDAAGTGARLPLGAAEPMEGREEAESPTSE
jgi:hypothetical protein